MANAEHRLNARLGVLVRRGLVLMVSFAVCFGSGCSGSDADRTDESAVTTETQSSTKQAQADNVNPAWVKASKSWPDTLRYTFDSTLEIAQDGLLLRLRPEVGLDVSGKAFPDEKPLHCEVLMTIRPVPAWPLAQGLVLDSVVLHDPVKDRDLPAVQMLSYQRSIDEGTVRTQFVANFGDPYRQSPDLTEGQEVNPTIYLSWDKRIIIAVMPPIPVLYLNE